jgi:hypothetical protein
MSTPEITDDEAEFNACGLTPESEKRSDQPEKSNG